MASLEAMMPNQARQSTPGDKEKMVKYRASQAANASGIASKLKDIQGRRTGLVIHDRVSKDSEGFEDIDAFWELASTGADELSERGSSAGGRAARRAAAGAGNGGGNSVGRYSRESNGLELGLDSTPGGGSTMGRRSSGVSSLGMPLSDDVSMAKRGGGRGMNRRSTLPAEAIAAARSRRSSILSTTSSSLPASSTPLSLDGSLPARSDEEDGAERDDSTPASLPARATGAAATAAAVPRRRLDFLRNQKGSLGGSAAVLRPSGGKERGREGGQDSGEESEAPTEEEFQGEEDAEAAAAAAAAVAARRRSSMGGEEGGGFDGDWAAGGSDDYMGEEDEEGRREERIDGESPVKGTEEEEEEKEKAAAAAKIKKEKKGAAAAAAAVKKKATAEKRKKQNKEKPRNESDTELSSYEEDGGEDGEERRKTQERFRRLRLSEYNREMGGKSLLQGEEGGEGGIGERRSTRRKVQPLQFWRNERVLYAVESTEGVDESRRKEGGREGGVDCMMMKEVVVANDTPVARRRRKRKGGKSTATAGKMSKRGKIVEGEERGREDGLGVMDPEKVYKKHPGHVYVKDGSGKGKVWDERKALRATRRVVIREEQVVMRPLENEEEEGVALEAGHAFRVLQVARSADDREAHEPSLLGYPGWVAGHMSLMPRKGKDPENVGPCSQVFHVLDCEKNSLELAVGELGEEAFSEGMATRFLLGKGDTFYLPPMNVYRLFNHSKRGKARVFWTIVKPWSVEEGEGGRGGGADSQSQSQEVMRMEEEGKKEVPAPVAVKRARKSSVAPTPVGKREKGKRDSSIATATKSGKGARKSSMAASAAAATAASASECEEEEEEEEEEVAEPSGEESGSEQGVEASESESSDSEMSE
ncbi:Hypothetical protein NocV09_00400620 [Nannochloropsis oceanica]